MRRSSLVADSRQDLDQRPIHLAPAVDLRDVQLIAAERPRHPVVDLEEEAGPTDERGDVVGADTPRLK